jgi:hypothetical protein
MKNVGYVASARRDSRLRSISSKDETDVSLEIERRRLFQLFFQLLNQSSSLNFERR